jgi:hypothetical protein
LLAGAVRLFGRPGGVDAAAAANLLVNLVGRQSLLAGWKLATVVSVLALHTLILAYRVRSTLCTSIRC